MKSTDQPQYFLKVEQIDRVRYNKMYTLPLLSIIVKELNLNIIKPDYRRNRIKEYVIQHHEEANYQIYGDRSNFLS